MAASSGLSELVADEARRKVIAREAVIEVGQALRDRRDLASVAAHMGFKTIQRLRPGFLRHHLYQLLPSFAEAMDPHWHAGVEAGAPGDYLLDREDEVTASVLEVADNYVEEAVDPTAVAVYRRLRPLAPRRIAEQMPRIVAFIERHLNDTDAD